MATVNYALGLGNRLAGWTVVEDQPRARLDVAGSSSKPIGTDSRFGQLWVGASSTNQPAVTGTNFFAQGVEVGAGTQQVVAAIRDAAGNVGRATNAVVVRVATVASYGYNAAGCLTNISYGDGTAAVGVGLTWNGQYQLTATTTNGVAAEQYGYDALGRRIWTASGGVTTYSVYDGAQVIADVTSGGALLRSYTWGPGIDNLLALTVHTGATARTYYAIKDHLGSVHALVDASGNVVEQYRSDAWGRTTVFDGVGHPLAQSAIGNRYVWQGRETSGATGLYYFRARWYDPVWGRWLSNDPIGISGGLNQYVFCANNPVNFTDPFGQRDVNVYVWNARGIIINPSGSAGHIMVTEYKSNDTILSQFPHQLGGPRTSEGPNYLLNRKDTYKAMGRPPDAIYTVNVPDDKAFNDEACKQRRKTTWNWKPTNPDQTHCARAAYDALRAGGVPIPENPGQAMPGTLGDDLSNLIGNSKAKVRQGF